MKGVEKMNTLQFPTALRMLKTSFVVFALCSNSFAFPNTIQSTKLSGTYKREQGGFYKEFTFLKNGNVILYDAVFGIKYEGSYTKSGNAITIKYKVKGKIETITLQQEDDNTLMHTTYIKDIIPKSDRYVKGNGAKQVITKAVLLGNWNVTGMEQKDNSVTPVLGELILALSPRSWTFRDDGKIIDGQGKIIYSYSISDGQLFIDGSNAHYELKSLDGRPLLKVTIKGNTEYKYDNIFQLKKL
jgi:hypothetical protein